MDKKNTLKAIAVKARVSIASQYDDVDDMIDVYDFKDEIEAIEGVGYTDLSSSWASVDKAIGKIYFKYKGIFGNDFKSFISFVFDIINDPSLTENVFESGVVETEREAELADRWRSEIDGLYVLARYIIYRLENKY